MTHAGEPRSPEPAWDSLMGQALVLDLSSPYVILGTLEQLDQTFVKLKDADVHDLRDSKTTRELYVLEALLHGIRSNRTRVWVRLDDIVSLSLLSDVVQ